MEAESQVQAVFCKTKAGKGFKIVINGKWFYTSKAELFNVLNNKTTGCRFRSIPNNAVLQLVDNDTH